MTETSESSGVPYAGVRLAALLAAMVALAVWRPWLFVVIAAVVLMIGLHELGHFVMAKRAGMKVTEFFLFFGPKVWSIKRGETEYGIKCIPAGAYVKIIGMTNLEEVDPADEGRTYRQKTFGQRVKVAVAGSAMHFMLAIVLIFVALTVTGQPGGTIDVREQNKNWQIGAVAEGTGAASAGLQPGDIVLSIDGVNTEAFADVREVSTTHKGDTVPFVIDRDGTELTVPVDLKPFYSWYVDRVPEGSPVEDAGLVADDQIVSIDGIEVRGVRDLDAVLQELEGTTVPVEYVRMDETEIRSTDLMVESFILEGGEAFIGITAEFQDPETIGVLPALVQAPVDFGRVTWMSMQALGSFFTPSGISDFVGQLGSASEDRAAANPTSTETSATLHGSGAGGVNENRLMSIFGLVMLGSEVGEVQPGALITLFALINMFIGVFNLIPLLPFDGGHVMIAVYEKIQEKRLHQRRYFADVSRLMPLVYVVVVGLGLLFVSTLYLDIANPIT
ncbi:MAG: RIP metalloprotease RseP [Aquihabitans sp.]